MIMYSHLLITTLGNSVWSLKELKLGMRVTLNLEEPWEFIVIYFDIIRSYDNYHLKSSDLCF